MSSDKEENAFENLPFDEAIQIYIDYLIATRAGDIKSTNAIFEKYPDLFQPETLKLAKETIVFIARRNKDPGLRNLISSVDNKAFDDE